MVINQNLKMSLLAGCVVQNYSQPMKMSFHKSGLFCRQIMVFIGHLSKQKKSESNLWSMNAYIRIPTCVIFF